MVHAHEVKNGCVDVMDMRFVYHGLEAEFVCLSVAYPAFHSAAGHPHGKTVRVVVSAGRTLAFAERHSAKFASPNDES